MAERSDTDISRNDQIEFLDVRTLHAKIGQENGKYGANRMLSLLGTMFQKAMDADDVNFEGPNPARGITRFDEKSRERFLQADELPAFFDALNEEPNPTIRDFFLVAILTGARRSNVLAMRWEEINLDRATWTIPETKSGDSQIIHLSGEAVRILRERRETEEAKARQKETPISPWVFPSSRRTSQKGHLGDPAKAWDRIRERSGLHDVRIHDLRRTLGSWQAATGASLPVIGKSLGHKNQSTTAIYARLDLDPVKVSVDTATAAMMAAAKPDEQKDGEGLTDPTVEGGDSQN